MYTRGKIADITADETIPKLLKAIWFELVEINNKIDTIIKENNNG